MSKIKIALDLIADWVSVGVGRKRGEGERGREGRGAERGRWFSTTPVDSSHVALTSSELSSAGTCECSITGAAWLAGI